MADQRLADYVKSALSTNKSVEQIKQDLISRGWSNSDINEAFDIATNQQLFHEPKKHPKFLMMFTLLIVIVSAGLIGSNIIKKRGESTQIEAAPTFNLVKDCMDNIDCFIDASKSCKASRLKFTSAPVSMLGARTNNTLYETKGLEDGKCALYLKADSLDGVCKYNMTVVLTASLSRWKAGNYSSNDFKIAECSGSMFGQP